MSVYTMTANDAAGAAVEFEGYRGKVLLVVNTATGCGFTPQYEGLQELYDKYHERGFEILDFPCNQFGHQAPGTNEEIVSFCQTKYNTTFRQFAKIEVNGANEHPLYKWLKGQKCGVLGDNIKWNFTKFLIDREGAVVARYAPTTTPKAVADAIEKLL